MTDFTAAYGRLSANARGTLWMLASAFIFTIMVTLVKYLGDEYSPALQTFYRQAAGLLVLAPIILRDPKAAYKTTRPGLLLFRAGCLTAGAIMAFYAYQEMPLAEANALSFTRTLWMVPLAAFALREAVGPWRLGATLVGFLGVLVMLRPSPESVMSLPALAALFSGLLFALGITGMKFMTRDHSLTALTVWGATLGLALATPLALLEWRWPTPIDLALLAGMGAFGLVAQVCYIRGMTLGDAGAMASIDYTRLVFAAIIGFALFQEIPDFWAMAGAAIVIAATLAITLREARLNKPPALSPE
jgi:drug/metabolite transporter (DMT)-like permease